MGFSTPLGAPKAVHFLFCCGFFFPSAEEPVCHFERRLKQQHCARRPAYAEQQVAASQTVVHCLFWGGRVWSPRKMMWKHAKQRKTAMSSEEARPLLHEFWKTRWHQESSAVRALDEPGNGSNGVHFAWGKNPHLPTDCCTSRWGTPTVGANSSSFSCTSSHQRLHTFLDLGRI